MQQAELQQACNTEVNRSDLCSFESAQGASRGSARRLGERAVGRGTYIIIGGTQSFSLTSRHSLCDGYAQLPP